MQISTGLVNVTNGSPTVTGNSSVDWSQVTTESLFVHLGQVYEINSVNAGAKTLQLSAPFAGVTASDQQYVIARDFTTQFNLPLLNPGDLEAAALFARAMWMIDSLISRGSGTASLGEVLINKTAHGFRVGNFVTLSGSTWVQATSSSIATANVVGCIKDIPDANSFRIVTQGYVSGVTGITMTAGTVYYLRLTVSGGVNISSSLLDVGIQVPVFVADGPASGFILNLARANSAVFTVGQAGAVPAPNSGDVSAARVLSAAGTWIAASIAANSLLSQHLDKETGAVNWDSFAAGGTNLSVFKHLVNLWGRVVALESIARRNVVSILRRDKIAADTNPAIKTFTVPTPCSSIRVFAYSGNKFTPRKRIGNSANYADAFSTPAVGAELLIDVEPGNVITAEFGRAYRYNDSDAESGRTIIRKDGVIIADIRLGSGSSVFKAITLTGSDIHLVQYSEADVSRFRYAYDLAVANPYTVTLDDASTMTYSSYAPFFWASSGLADSCFAGFVQIEYLV